MQTDGMEKVHWVEEKEAGKRISSRKTPVAGNSRGIRQAFA